MYSKEYYDAINEWENIAESDIDILKGHLHHPYKINKDFSSIISSIVSLKNSDLKTLYFGCGIGRNLSFLQKISNRVDGFDIPKMIERCRQENGDFDNLYSNWNTCRTNHYDLVIDVFSLQFIPDITAISDILIDIAKMSNYFYLVTRNYINDKHYTNIIDLINKLDIFKIIDSSTNTKSFAKEDFPITVYGEFLFQSKTTPSNTKIELVSNNKQYLYDDEHIDIAFIDGAYHHMSGNKYYDTILVYLLSELKYRIKWYTNSIDYPLISNFYQYSSTIIQNSIPDICPTNIETLDIPFANCYIGVVGNSNEAIKAIELGAKYHQPTYIIVYDCPLDIDNPIIAQQLINMGNVAIDKYRYVVKIELELYNKLKNAIHKYYTSIPQLKIITLTEQSIDSWSRFLDIAPSHFISINPCINNRIKDSIRANTKKNQIVTISRDAWNKNFDETFEIFKDFYDDYNLHVITGRFDGFYDRLQEHNISRYRTTLHHNISDADKFIILKESKLLFSNSIFEGFGMWAIEGLSCGIPVICYDLDSIKEINHPHLYKIPKFDKQKFRQTMEFVLSQNIEFDEINRYNFDTNITTIKQKINIPVNDISGFTKNTGKKYIISTKFQTSPFIFHFNSIYNRKTCPHHDASRKYWSKILNSIQNNPIINPISKSLNIFTFSDKPIPTILEVSCKLQNIPLTVLGANIKKWRHEDKIGYDIDYLESIDSEYILFLDSLDVVIYGNIMSILDFDLDNRVLFAAEEVCHPYSEDIATRQADRIKDSIFKYLNAGVFFGKRLDVLNVCKLANKYIKYKAADKACDGCDQGRFNQLYLDRPDLIELDSMCRFFYCNDYATEANKWLVIQ